LVKGHSIVNIAKDLGLNGEIESAGQVLDLYYISSRYPDALPDYGVPYEYFGLEQAKQVLELVLKWWPEQSRK